MGWGIVIPDVYLSRVTKSELPTKLEEAKDSITYCKNKILALMAATPREIKDCEDNPIQWEDHVVFELNEIFEFLAESLVHEYLYSMALDRINELEEE